jgi:sugar phosphate isomerase/epimerase
MTIPIALQLYTVRQALEQDFTAVIEQVAQIGYVGVETASFPEGITAFQAADIIKANGLTIAAAHCELPLGVDEAAVLGLMDDLGNDTMVWHGWPRHDDHDSVDGVKRLAERYNQAYAVAEANGMNFGIHNHWWEFQPVGNTYPYRILLAELDENIFFEVDTYWVKTAGLAPTAVLKELGSRAKLLHIKDGPATQDDDMVAVGEGVMDFTAIFAAATKPDWAIVELDRCGTDMMTAVRESYNYLTSHGLVKGNK